MSTAHERRLPGRQFTRGLLFLLCALPLTMGQTCGASSGDSSTGSTNYVNKITSCSDMNGRIWYVWSNTFLPRILTIENCKVVLYQRAYVGDEIESLVPLDSQITVTDGENGAKHLLIEFTLPDYGDQTKRHRIEGDIVENPARLRDAVWSNCTYVGGVPDDLCVKYYMENGTWPGTGGYAVTQNRPY